MEAFDKEQFLLEWGGGIVPTTPYSEPYIESNFNYDDVELTPDEDGIEDICYDLMEQDLYGETFLYHRLRPLRSSIPSCLKVEKHPDDDFILKQLDESKPISWLSERKYDVDKLVNHQVALMLASNHSYLLERILKASREAQDDTIATSIIQAVVTLIFMLHRKETLFRKAHERSRRPQMNKLWKGLSHLGEKAAPRLQALELITQLVMDKHKYSFITEEDASDIFSDYCLRVGYGPFTCHRYMDEASTPESTSDIPAESHVIDEDKKMFEVIHNVIKEMKSIPTPLKDDHYVRLLMALLRDKLRTDEEYWLIDEAMKVLQNTELNEELKLDLHDFLGVLINDFKINLKPQLMKVTLPLSYQYGSGDCDSDIEIIEIIQVAELRRMALGRRFISRSHLIWAYYECGYGLPLFLRNKIKFISFTDEDNPPYHIYVAAKKLADSLGMKGMKLECFIHAVFFSDSVGGFDEEKMEAIEKHYKSFLAESVHLAIFGSSAV